MRAEIASSASSWMRAGGPAAHGPSPAPFASSASRAYHAGREGGFPPTRMSEHFRYRDPLEATLATELSPEILMEHTRRIAADERESGTPGETRAFDYIATTLERYGLTIQRRQIEAVISLPQEARITLPDGGVIHALTDSFSASTDALEAELIDAVGGNAEDYTRVPAQRGPVRITVMTRVNTGWTPIPHLVAHLDGRAEDRFVLLSGHVDSWHHGAMDNASANATMMEVARLCARHRDRLRRGLRVAFWSGHSHGRYAGSAWYADHAWHELHRRCVLHLNCDSTGARGAIDYGHLHATEDVQSFAEAVVGDVTGQMSRGHRFSRAGDQSFWGAGVSS